MKFEFTTDRKLINECVTSPHVWRMSTDDRFKGVNPNLLFISIEKFLWVKVEDYGVFMLENIDNDTCRIHVAFNKKAIGKSKEICAERGDWIFANTSYKTIEALIPESNALAIRLAKLCGMDFIKNVRRSFMKDGIAHDQYLFNLNRGTTCQYH